MEPQQPSGVKAGETRPLGLDRRADRLQPDEQPLPGIGHAGRVGRNQHQAGAAGQRLAQPHPGMDAERLGGERHLAHLLAAPGSGASAAGSLQQPGPIAGGDGELEAGEQRRRRRQS